MATYKELIYIVSELAKQISKDATLVNENIVFLLKKYRTYLLKQKYNNKAIEPSQSNYQTVCADLQLVPAMPGCSYQQCIDGDNTPLLRSKKKLVLPLTFSETQVSIFRCPGIYSLVLKIKNNWLTKEQVKYINNLFNFEVIPVYKEGPRGNDYNQDSQDVNLYKQMCDIYLYPEFDSFDHTITFTYNIATDLYTTDYDIELKDEESYESIYITNCSEDAQTLISLLSRQGINAELDIISQSEGACNEETFYTAAVRRFGNVNVVNKERFNYVGYNKYFKNGVYATIGIDNYLYVKSNQDLQLFDRALVTAVFEDPEKAQEISSCTYLDGEGNPKPCPNTVDGNCDPWDNEFPIEDALQTQLINLVLRDILGAAYRPADKINSANDELSSIESFIANNMKERYNKDREAQV